MAFTMSYAHRRQVLRAGLVSLAHFVIGGPLTPHTKATSTYRGMEAETNY
jgi:hypothetical protein